VKFKFYTAKAWDAIELNSFGDYAKADDLKKALELLRECKDQLPDDVFVDELKKRLEDFLSEN
jgi:hypothetical protein